MSKASEPFRIFTDALSEEIVCLCRLSHCRFHVFLNLQTRRSLRQYNDVYTSFIHRFNAFVGEILQLFPQGIVGFRLHRLSDGAFVLFQTGRHKMLF